MGLCLRCQPPRRFLGVFPLRIMEKDRLQHKANRLAFDTQFPYIDGKKSKPPLLQFPHHECLSAGRRPTRRLRIFSLGANLYTYLSDPAQNALANVRLGYRTTVADSEGTCCGR